MAWYQIKNRVRAAIKAFQDPGMVKGKMTSGTGPGGIIWHKTEPVTHYQYWIYAAINCIARNMAKVPFKVMIWNGEAYEEVKEHPLIDLLYNVNENMNYYELIYMHALWMELTGNSYWYIVRDNTGKPREIWDLEPGRVKVVAGKERLVSGYVYMAPDGTQVPFSIDEIIHFKYPNPHSRFYGLSPVEAMMYLAGETEAMHSFAWALFRNSANPGMILTTDEVVDDVTFKRLKEEWEDAYKGVTQAGKTMFLDAGFKPERIGMTMQELSFIEGRKLVRNETLSFFGVPITKLGFGEEINRATAEELDKTFWSETIEPKMIMLSAKINEKLCPMYNNQMEIAFIVPVVTNKEIELKQMELDLEKGVKTINMIRAERGEPPVDWGDRPILPMQMIPLGETFKTERVVVNAEEKEEQEQNKRIKIQVPEVYRWEAKQCKLVGLKHI